MRRGKAPKRFLQPDVLYNDVAVSKFINCLMKQGKKRLATSILYKAFDIIEEKTKQNGYKLFQKAFEQVTPVVELKSRRIRGATYQVPIEARPARKIYLCIQWLITSARMRKEKTMSLRLAHELIAASQGEGNAIKKKANIHKMAQANKGFSHFKF